MSWVFILVVVVVVAATFLAVAGKKAGTGLKVGFPYVPAKALFSPAERSFLRVASLHRSRLARFSACRVRMDAARRRKTHHQYEALP